MRIPATLCYEWDMERSFAGASWRATICMLLLLAVLWPTMAAAGIRVEVKGVDDEFRQAVLASVEISRYADREVSAAKAQRLFDRALTEAAQALRPFGYYHARANGKLSEVKGGWLATLNVEMGEPIRVATVEIDLGDSPLALPEIQRALARFDPREGEIFNHSAWETSKAAVQAALTETGFLDARMTTHKVEVSLADKRARIQLTIEPGQRYRFGETRFEGSQFRDGFLDRYLPWQAGDWFSQSQLLALQQRLVSADYFALVQVDPDFDAAGDGTLPIVVHLAPAKRSVYTGGPFIGTDTGAGIRAGVERRWVNNRGHTANIQVLFAQRLQTAHLSYTIPLADSFDHSFNFGLEMRKQETATSESQTLSVVARESRIWHGFHRSIGLRFLTGDFTVGSIKRNSSLLFPEITLAKKVGADPLYVRDGWSIRATARAAYEGLVSDTSFAQVVLHSQWIHAFNKSNRILLRGAAGSMWVGDFHKLPPELRFFAGGARSVRGFDYEAIGPRNEVNDVIGGRNLLAASVSVEHYFNKNWGMAAFVDAGDAFSDLEFDAHVGAGLGLRWRSPVGLVRVDVGVPIQDRYFSGVQLHIVLGPDL